MVGGFEESLHVVAYPSSGQKGVQMSSGCLMEVLGASEKIMMICKMKCLTVVPVTNIQRCLRGLHDLWCEISRVTEEPGVRQKMDGCLAF